MKTMNELVKENTKLIQENYNFATEIHECKIEIISLKKTVLQLQEVVDIQGKLIEKLENSVSILQKQMEEMRH